MKIGVVAHPKRIHQAETVRRMTQAEYIRFDHGSEGAIANHTAVWKWMADNVEEREWAVVLEDDAVPVPFFRQQCEKALWQAPTEVVSLYLGRQRPVQSQPRIRSAVKCAEREDAHWILWTSPIFGVAIAIKGSLLIDSMLRWLEKRPETAVDEAISQWCIADTGSGPYGHPAAFTWPSLVDHSDGPTLIPTRRDGQPRPPGRVAWMTGLRDSWDRNRTVRM